MDIVIPLKDLVRVPDPERPVVQKDGGPMYELVAVDGDTATVRELTGWSDERLKPPEQLPVALLYACVPLAEHLASHPLEGLGG